MYDDHYGMTERPFQLTPDPRFWFETATHRRAMAYIGHGLSQGEGVIVVTGDVGTGKTMLIEHVIATIDPARLHVIQVVATRIGVEALLRLIAAGLGLDATGQTEAQLLTAVERAVQAVARDGRRTLVIVDDAQALPVASLEALRLLSGFETDARSVLQVFLLGQSAFRDRLYESDRLERLRQRVIVVHHLDPMGPAEVEPYIRHRLSVVGATDSPQFTRAAFDALHAASDGVPRRLNQLMGRVLLFGALEQLTTIDATTVRVVMADIAGDLPGPKPATPHFRQVAGEAVEPPALGAEHDVLPVELEQRVAMLEARIEAQDVALRRVLTLLIDWAEAGHGPIDISNGHGN